MLKGPRLLGAIKSSDEIKQTGVGQGNGELKHLWNSLSFLYLPHREGNYEWVGGEY